MSDQKITRARLSGKTERKIKQFVKSHHGTHIDIIMEELNRLGFKATNDQPVSRSSVWRIMRSTRKPRVKYEITSSSPSISSDQMPKASKLILEENPYAERTVLDVLKMGVPWSVKKIVIKALCE